MSPGARRLLSLAVGCVLAGVLALGLLLSGAPSGRTEAASFTLPQLGGGPAVTVPVVRHGVRMPVVLTFFASWCGPCHTDVPVIARVARSLSATGTRVAFVGVDGNDDPASGLAFARRSGVAFPVAEDATSAVAPRYGLPGYPATVFIDASGTVVDVVRGPISASTLTTWAQRIGHSR